MNCLLHPSAGVTSAGLCVRCGIRCASVSVEPPPIQEAMREDEWISLEQAAFEAYYSHPGESKWDDVSEGERIAWGRVVSVLAQFYGVDSDDLVNQPEIFPTVEVQPTLPRANAPPPELVSYYCGLHGAVNGQLEMNGTRRCERCGRILIENRSPTAEIPKHQAHERPHTPQAGNVVPELVK